MAGHRGESARAEIVRGARDVQAGIPGVRRRRPLMDLAKGLFGSGTIGGSSAKRDRSEQLDAFGDLRNTFNWALPTAKSGVASGTATTGAGLEDLGTAGNYFKKLAGGDRAAVTQAVAPETAAVTASSDAAKREEAASGTARGGGVAATNQTRDEDTMSKVDQMLFGVRPG